MTFRIKFTMSTSLLIFIDCWTTTFLVLKRLWNLWFPTWLMNGLFAVLNIQNFSLGWYLFRPETILRRQDCGVFPICVRSWYLENSLPIRCKCLLKICRSLLVELCWNTRQIQIAYLGLLFESYPGLSVVIAKLHICDSLLLPHRLWFFVFFFTL